MRRATHDAVRVLYLHGLEETADSPKPQALVAEADFEVLVPPLDIFFTKQHSPLRYLLQQPWLWVAVACGGGAAVGAAVPLAGTGHGAWVALASGLLVAAALIGYKKEALVAGALQGSYAHSLRQAHETLLAFHPDVLIGFSWGGALACEVIAAGLWSGPTLLLAPAGQLLARRMCRERALDDLHLPVNCIVIHSSSDQVVPLQHSQDLCAGKAGGGGTPLRIVDGMKHDLWGLAKDGTLPAVVRELVANGQAARARTGGSLIQPAQEAPASGSGARIGNSKSEDGKSIFNSKNA